MKKINLNSQKADRADCSFIIFDALKARYRLSTILVNKMIDCN